MTTLTAHDLPEGFEEAICARMDRDIVPDLPPPLAAAWRGGIPSWEILEDHEHHRIAVDVFATTVDGRIHLARIDGETLGFTITDDGYEWTPPPSRSV